MKYICFIFFIVIYGCKTVHQPKVINSRFINVKTPPKPDYSKLENWAALPQLHDPSDSISKQMATGTVLKKADVFWIHPTTYTGKPDSIYMWNAAVENNLLNHKTDYSTILYQASIFNEIGNIYAPRYRQAHYYSFTTPNKQDKWLALQLAYSDVKSAFDYFLKNYYSGGSIIIAAHSQGSIHAYWLLRDYFKNKPMMNKLVAAYLVGMPILSDSLAFILPCTTPQQTNCYLAWNTFQYGHLPNDSNLYNATFVINPLTWNVLNISAKRKANMGSILFNYNKIKKRRVDAQTHKGVLWIHKPLLLMSLFYRDKNYHIGDYNLFYSNIRQNVKYRLEKYYSQEVKQTGN
jgi:hypothetical protein